MGGDSLSGAELSRVGCCGDTSEESVTTAEERTLETLFGSVASGYTVCGTCVHGYLKLGETKGSQGEATEMLERGKDVRRRKGWPLVDLNINHAAV